MSYHGCSKCGKLFCRYGGSCKSEKKLFRRVERKEINEYLAEHLFGFEHGVFHDWRMGNGERNK